MINIMRESRVQLHASGEYAAASSVSGMAERRFPAEAAGRWLVGSDLRHLRHLGLGQYQCARPDHDQRPGVQATADDIEDVRRAGCQLTDGPSGRTSNSTETEATTCHTIQQ